MPKRAAGLSARAVQTMKAPGMFADGDGLYLQVTASGAKSWVFRYQLAGRRRDMGLGPLSAVSLAEAREKAQEARKLVKAGVDPIEQKKEAAAAQVAPPAERTFAECAEAYVASMSAEWDNAKHAAQWSSTLATYAYPVMGSLPIKDVALSHVLDVLEPIWREKTETASRVRGRIEAVLDYARVRGYREGENPARWKGNLDHILPRKAKVARVEHHTALPYADMPGFWPKLQAHDGLGARALELCILTATRTGEVLGAVWDEVDIEAAVWTIPAERMKARKEHRMPLTGPAIALLRKMAAIRRGAFVFPGQRPNRPLSNMAMVMVLRRMKVDATPHGFRSTFRTWAAEQTTHPHEVAEAALAHTQADKVVAAYQRGDFFERRRRLMEDWAAFCEGREP